LRKAAHPSGGVGSSNPHCWRGKQLCHHGDGVCKVVCDFCAVLQLVTLQSGSSNVKNERQHNLKMRLMVLLFAPHWLAPYPLLPLPHQPLLPAAVSALVASFTARYLCKDIAALPLSQQSPSHSTYIHCSVRRRWRIPQLDPGRLTNAAAIAAFT
jgi:hypothetical protein